MKTYIFSFKGYEPVGAFMYVRANFPEDANELFKAELRNVINDPRREISLYVKNVHANGDLKREVQRTEIKPGRRSYMISDGDY